MFNNAEYNDYIIIESDMSGLFVEEYKLCGNRNYLVLLNSRVEYIYVE